MLFSNKEFNHLVYQTKKKPRDERVQITKFSLLSKAKQLLAISTTYQEYEEDIKPVKVRRHKKILHESALIKYWGLIAIIGKTRIKVVVRQTGDGKKEFYSVIPAWVARNYREIKLIENTVRGGLIDEDDAETLKNATEK